MKKVIGNTILSFMLVSCSSLFIGDEPSNSAVSTFDAFWSSVDRTWPEFASKGVNWDSLYSVYRPQVDSISNDTELASILKALLLNLEDRHTVIYPNSSSALKCFPAYPRNFYGINGIKVQYLPNFKESNTLLYGLIGTDIGYIHIKTFLSSLDQYTQIDNIIQDFGNIKGIILDVRNNGGGSTLGSEAIASRFANQKRIYAYGRWRTGRKRDQMGEFVSFEVEPRGRYFSGKVAVLTSRYSYSATENFILMMRAFPNRVLIGDYTGGGSGTGPLLRELPNGWLFTVSSYLLCGLNKLPITGGIVPDFYVQTTAADSIAGKDTIIEKALIELK